MRSGCIIPSQKETHAIEERDQGGAIDGRARVEVEDSVRGLLLDLGRVVVINNKRVFVCNTSVHIGVGLRSACC